MAKTARKATKQNVAADLLEERFAALDRGREGYQKADELLERLIATVGVGGVIRLDDGREYEIEDQFATKNKVWKPCGVSRYDIVKKR